MKLIAILVAVWIANALYVAWELHVAPTREDWE